MKKCALISNFFPKKAKAGGVVSPTSTTTKQGSSSVLVVATSGTSNSSTGSTHHTAPPPNAMDVVVVQDDDDDDNDDVVESFEKKQEICVVMAACASSRDLDVKGTEHDGMAVLESTPLGTTAAETAAPPDDDQDVVEVLSPELAKNEPKDTNNPFAKFLCPAAATRRPPLAAASIMKKRRRTNADPGVKALDEPRRDPPPAVQRSSRQSGRGGGDFVKMRDLPPDERERVVAKWHSMADPSAPLEVRRFQVFVAARLHAQCREITVRQAVDRLRHVLVDAGGLTVEGVAGAAAEDLVPALASLQYHSVKAAHLIQASQAILAQFRGQVPEREAELRQLPGIGPVFADLLAFVNTRQSHLRQSGNFG